jgi:hypothetical protein
MGGFLFLAKIWAVFDTYCPVFLLVMGFIATDRLAFVRHCTGIWWYWIYQQSINNLSTNILWYCGTVGTFGDFSQNRGCCKHYNTIFVKTIDKCKIIVTFGDCKQKITENGKN